MSAPRTEQERETTREPQYNRSLEIRDELGLTRLGVMANRTWYEDPKRLTFVLARYKFAAKMLRGRSHVLEIGCADAFGTRLVAQEVDRVTATDFDPIFVEDAQRHMDDRWRFEVLVHDILEAPVPGEFDGALSLDVIEHIPAERERDMVGNIAASLTDHGALVMGSPSLQSQVYASPGSKEGHVNCKDGDELRSLMQEFFHNVFVFSMNDEVVHTGFHPMAHYLLALCCDKRT